MTAILQLNLAYSAAFSRDRNGRCWLCGVIVTKDGTGCC